MYIFYNKPPDTFTDLSYTMPPSVIGWAVRTYYFINSIKFQSLSLTHDSSIHSLFFQSLSSSSHPSLYKTLPKSSESSINLSYDEQAEFFAECTREAEESFHCIKTCPPVSCSTIQAPDTPFTIEPKQKPERSSFEDTIELPETPSSSSSMNKPVLVTSLMNREKPEDVLQASEKSCRIVLLTLHGRVVNLMNFFRYFY